MISFVFNVAGMTGVAATAGAAERAAWGADEEECDEGRSLLRLLVLVLVLSCMVAADQWR